MEKIVGILGGMGPLATADFLRKLVERTPAARDQEHVPVVVYSVPQLPDRSEAILHHGPSPLAGLLQGAAVLRRAGAGCIAIPCNTAHFWADELAARSALPVLHIADAVVAELAASAAAGAAIGILGTAGTLAAGIYQQRLERQGYRVVLPDADDLDHLLMPGIRAVKGGDLATGGRLLAAAGTALQARGAAQLVLACTEIPLALAAVAAPGLPRCVDATACLAAACIDWWRAADAPGAALLGYSGQRT
ncbi:aspartate/glutamate racemase family protein [Azospira restricta]|uniref:Amino acid racemase n=1 Tax=Azospira restricta TaxID=404405 RepID=A0A974SNP7_9RHOO|nr:amino acid racemase [Azospira restricta]QRJ63644.1 amino acid racemase [Azospira restricta]